jgi:flavin reductase (DIM6/NTAB) family NADH-FMN oxidoreductase RutF
VRSVFTFSHQGSFLLAREGHLGQNWAMKKSLGPKPILFPTPVFIIGTYDSKGLPNVAAVSWGGICSSDPPCVCISLRRVTHTFSNITAQQAFTINLPSQDQVQIADYFGLISGKSMDKFAKAKMTPVKSTLVNAPYVKEFPMSLECKVRQTVEIGLHVQFIAEILDVKISVDALNPSGNPDIKKVNPMIFDPATHSYFGVGSFIADAFSIGEGLR